MKTGGSYPSESPWDGRHERGMTFSERRKRRQEFTDWAAYELYHTLDVPYVKIAGLLKVSRRNIFQRMKRERERRSKL